MHIVQCLTHSIIGGGQQVVCTLVKNLSRLRPDVRHTVVLPARGIFAERFRQLGVSVIELPLDAISPLAALSLRHDLRRLRPDIVHSHGKGAGLYARTLGPRSARFVHSFHGFHAPPGPVSRRLYTSLERLLLKKTDRVVNVSAGEQADFQRQCRVPEDRCTVIPNVVDGDDLKKRARNALPDVLRKFFDSGFIVAMIGRDDPLKNYPLAFSAARTLLDADPRMRFVFVGVSPQKPERLEFLSHYAGRVVMLSSLEDTAPLIARSHVLLIPSKREGSPLVVLEAFSLGKPVVGTNASGVRDNIRHQFNGLLCEESAESLASALARLAGDRSLYEQVSSGATASGTGQKELEAWVEAYYRLYQQLA